MYLTGCPNWRQYCNGPPPAKIFMSKHCKRTCDTCDDTGGPSFSCPAKTTNVDQEGPLVVPLLDENQRSIIRRRGEDWHVAPIHEYMQPQNFVHIRGKLFNSDCSEMKRASDFITLWYAGASNRTGHYLSICFCLQRRPMLMLFAVAAFASNPRGGGKTVFIPVFSQPWILVTNLHVKCKCMSPN